MEECIALVEVYKLLLMSPLMRKISACAATTSALSLSRMSLTPKPKSPQLISWRSVTEFLKVMQKQKVMIPSHCQSLSKDDAMLKMQ